MQSQEPLFKFLPLGAVCPYFLTPFGGWFIKAVFSAFINEENRVSQNSSYLGFFFLCIVLGFSLPMHAFEHNVLAPFIM